MLYIHKMQTHYNPSSVWDPRLAARYVASCALGHQLSQWLSLKISINSKNPGDPLRWSFGPFVRLVSLAARYLIAHNFYGPSTKTTSEARPGIAQKHATGAVRAVIRTI